ncbi:hypothetical protein Tb09.160.0940 [Trypanosoma brucei brucei TREU927]|uniref:Uncharacterized protein n=1 Tax=Trypanosoma brucei brucei (strain 927/4 GUTat10.1) TaxID=185431 RepID=Q38FU4_TRYB2|nr:hypothetical protein Tb09.160.0940 [Trypanosoma brucei brucei TREU927]EAN76326.1 hypothetical protein Tb09.160.0940 [Trypanosoma brucei brucei TREU927]
MFLNFLDNSLPRIQWIWNCVGAFLCFKFVLEDPHHCWYLYFLYVYPYLQEKGYLLSQMQRLFWYFSLFCSLSSPPFATTKNTGERSLKKNC